MAVTNQELFNIFLANPNMSDAQIVSLMETRGISPSQISETFGIPEGQVAARVGAALPPNQAVLLGDTYVQAVNQVSGSGENQQVGGIENVLTYKAGENKVGGGYQQYTPTGELQRTGVQQEVNANKDFLKFAALAAGGMYGLGGFDGLLGGATGATGTGLEFAGSGGAFDLANAGIAGGTAAFTPAELAAISSGTATGIGAGGAGATSLLTTPTTTAGGTGLKLGTSGLDTITATNTGLNTLTTGGNTGLLTTAGTTLAGLDTGVTAATAASTAAAAKIAADAKLAADAAAAAKLASKTGLITGGLKTAAGLIQSEEDKAAAQRAAADVTKATQAGVAGAQFRPVGMTTRFGTSQYTYDPVTGQMVSAGYQLSPEAKAQQDRLMALSNAGLTQAEQAQAQYAPLQTGAQRLFGLGNQYLAQSPEQVAQNYLNQQMSLLQPGREVELANLQNTLQQQGRAGLSVAQGGTMGATTPELQALYNARARQEAELAANAQQLGQRDVLFGAGLLGQGATAMGNYYGGQTQAFSPYTTAMGQVQGLETAGQQPLTMGANLAQQASTAGFNAGRLGLQGAGTAADISMGKAATTNPYASLLTGIADPTFAQGVAKQIWGV
jgi:hypothetical protein